MKMAGTDFKKRAQHKRLHMRNVSSETSSLAGKSDAVSANDLIGTVLFRSCALVFCLLVFHPLAARAVINEIPRVVPPFMATNKASQKFELKTIHVTDKSGKSGIQPTLNSGFKAVKFHQGLFRDYFRHPEKFIIEDKSKVLAEAIFIGQVNNGDYKGKWGEPFAGKNKYRGSLSVNEKDMSIVFSKEYHVSDDDKSFKTFTYSLTPLTDGKLKLQWDCGISPDELKAAFSTSWLSFKLTLFRELDNTNRFYHDTFIDYQNLRITCAEDAVKPASKQQLSGLKKYKTIKHINAKVGQNVLVDNSSGNLVALQVKNTPYSVAINEGVDSAGRGAMSIVASGLIGKGSLIIDMGKTAVRDDKQHTALGGVEFWRNDRMEMPSRPTRNLIYNPSFEQGFRYWRWWCYSNPRPGTQSERPCYEIVPDAKAGRQALKTHGTSVNQPITSFPIPLEVGATYTLSFYAKADGNHTRFTLCDITDKAKKWTAGKNWQRYSYSYVKKGKPLAVIFFSGSGVTIDGLQLEKGGRPTPFVSVPIEAELVTSDPDNWIQAGNPIKAALNLHGTPDLSGEVEISVDNYYRERVYKRAFNFRLDDTGRARLALPFDQKTIGKGVFIVRAAYTPASGGHYVDHYRLTIMEYLKGEHKTSRLFGNWMANQTSRPDDFAEMSIRCGWGARHGAASTAFASVPAIPYVCAMIDQMLDDKQKLAIYGKTAQQLYQQNQRDYLDLLTEDAALVEKICFDIVSGHPEIDTWTWATEVYTRSSLMRAGHNDKYVRFLQAMYRGIKRARSDAIVLPDGGPANMEIGWKQIETFLSADPTGQKIRWGGVGIHPYIYPDEIDIRTKRLISTMKEKGYGDAPIYFTESGNLCDTTIPEWSAQDHYDAYRFGRPSYDTGWREFMKAAYDARIYLAGLKFWPQVKYVSIWTVRPFIDLNLTPLMTCQAVNSLGHLFSDPTFVADICPSDGIKGMVFQDQTGVATAALWASRGNGVDQGRRFAPELLVDFPSQPEFIDLMGNSRTPLSDNGNLRIALSPAPLFIRTHKMSAQDLAKHLNAAKVIGGGAPITLKIVPGTNQHVLAILTNKTSRPLSGDLILKDKSYAFDLNALGETRLELAGEQSVRNGRLLHWSKTVRLAVKGEETVTLTPAIEWLPVPKANRPLPLDPKSPDWKAIPSCELANFYGKKTTLAPKSDLDAKIQMAWDKDNLYVRVECVDNEFLLDQEKWNSIPPHERNLRLYQFDGCVELYFDTFADARDNPFKDYDNNDCRYDFYAGDASALDGAGRVCRINKVFHQLAGGLTFPSDAEVEKEVKSVFNRNGNHYSYVMILPKRYLLPFELSPGTSAGFSIDIHDYDSQKSDEKYKKRTLVSEAGQSSYRRPDLWPTIILTE
jgi:hypothetical protein